MSGKMNRRTVLKIGVAGLGAAILGPGLISCAPKDQMPKQGEPQKISWWASANDNTWADEFWAPRVNKFLEKNPNVSVEYVGIPFTSHEAKLLSAFAGRSNAPDIFHTLVAPWAGCVAVADKMPEDLAERCEKEILKPFHGAYKYQGEWYGYPAIPTNGLGSMLFYNKAHFAEAGLSGPPKSMDELYEYGAALAQVDGAGNVTRSGFAHRYDDARGAGTGSKIIPFLHAFGAKIYDLENDKAEGVTNSAEAVDAMTFAQRLVEDKISSITMGKPEEQFAAGNASMFLRESFMVGWLHKNAPNVEFGVSYVPPQTHEAMGATGVVDWAFMVNKYSPAREAAWELFREVLATQDCDLAKAQLNGDCVAWAANWDSDYMKSREDYAALQYASEHYSETLYTHGRHQELGDRHAAAIQEILLLAKSPKQALDEAAADMQAIMDKGPCE